MPKENGRILRRFLHFCYPERDHFQLPKSLGFEWDSRSATWEDRLGELANYWKLRGHCNVPQRYSENSELGVWVANQRHSYRLQVKGKTSPMTNLRIQALEFEWESHGTAWENCLSELADYRKIHGHCNVPVNYSENTQLAAWVGMQRQQYRLHRNGKRSLMTLSRIQALESLGFEWQSFLNQGKGISKQPGPDDATKRVHEKAVEAPEHMQEHSLKKISVVEKSAAIKSTSLSKPKNPTRMSKSTLTISRVEPQGIRLVEAGEARFDETYLGRSPSELHVAGKPILRSDRQFLGKLAPPVGDSVESIARKGTLQAKLSRTAHQLKSISSFSHVLEVALPQENGFLVAAKKPANSRQGANAQLETAPSNEMLRANPAVAEPLEQRHNTLTHALLLQDGSTGNGIQAPDRPSNTPPEMQQTPPDEGFQSDNVLNEVEMEVIWLGEESMYCLSRPDFQFDFIYEYASPALKVELRKLSRDDHSETDKLKEIARMADWLVARRFDFVRNYIRKKLRRGFRRQRMGAVIAELRLLRRQQGARRRR